jgi:hypothetical protein
MVVSLCRYAAMQRAYLLSISSVNKDGEDLVSHQTGPSRPTSSFSLPRFTWPYLTFDRLYLCMSIYIYMLYIVVLY